MFQLSTFTEALVTSVTNRVEKHGDDEKKAVTLGLEITASNTLLDLIDPSLRHSLYRAKDDAEPELPEMERTTPVLRSNSFETHKLTTAYEGWTLAVDDGIDETQPMVFGGTKVDKFQVEAKQGGSIVLRFRAGTSDVDAEKLGKLAMHNGEAIWITLKAPEKKAGGTEATGADIDGTKGHPGVSAEDLFAGAGDVDPGDDDGDDDGEVSNPDAEAAGDALSEAEAKGENWPFPKDGAQPASDAAEFEAGAAQAIAAAGVTEKGRRPRKAAVHAE